MNGFAPALARLPAPLAGFALTWGACCGPAALLATRVTLGNRMLFIRLAAGFVAAVLTAALWCGARMRCPARCSDQAATPVEHLARAFTALGMAAAVAGCWRAAAPDLLTHTDSPLLAAIVGALLSPCAASDAPLARVLSPAPASQAAFMIAAQCLDVRQLSLLRRHFGPRRMLLAAAAAAAACAAAAALA
ncbi:MAG: hypothetical protein GIW99_05725 [Candidatus Eremiobacteraeota bacterium]|nr:hypothetical protein [Candidatus Eremiobacteraeota bacterium]MBC5827167.1 hypothetical protein [Candidatus Eremiobacteraeota bacterium]